MDWSRVCRVLGEIGLVENDAKQLTDLACEAGHLARLLSTRSACLYHNYKWQSVLTRMFLRTLVGMYVYDGVDEAHMAAIYHENSYCSPCAYHTLMKRFWHSELAHFLRVRLRRRLLRDCPWPRAFDRLRAFVRPFMRLDKLLPPPSPHDCVITQRNPYVTNFYIRAAKKLRDRRMINCSHARLRIYEMRTGPESYQIWLVYTFYHVDTVVSRHLDVHGAEESYVRSRSISFEILVDDVHELRIEYTMII
jgi:hypothetical protein